MSDGSVGTVQLGVDLDQSRLKRSLMGLEKQTSSGLSKSFGSTGMAATLGKLGGLAAGAFAVASLARFGSSAIKLGSDLAEVQNVVDVTFGAGAGTINKFAKSAMTGFGLSETSAKKYTGTMGAMLKSMGMGTGQATDMSMAMTGLAGDFASFYNLDSEEAFAKIRSGISGETEPLKQLGINMSVANLEAYALAQGNTTAYQSMDQASQALLRYNYLMSVSKDAQGDFARTSGSWANQTRVLALQWDSFKASFGQGLINLLSPILVGINKIMGGLMKMGAMFATITGAMFGSQNAAAGLGQSLAAIANSGGQAADGQNKAAKATKAAGKAASGSLASYDKLNVLQAPADAAGDAAGGGATFAAPSLGDAKSDSGYYTPKINEASIFMANLKSLFNFDAIKTSWANLKAALTPLGENIWAGLKWAWDNILVPFGQWVINSAVPTFLDMLSGAAKVLNGVIEALKPLGQWLWDKFLQPIAAWTGGAIITVMKGITDALTAVSDWIGSHQKTVETIAIVIGSFAAAWGLVNFAMGIWTVVGAIATGVTTGFGAAVAFLTSPIFLVALAIGALIAIGILLYRNWDTVKAFMINMWTAIKSTWSSAGTWFGNVFKSIGTAFDSVWKGIKATFISVINFLIKGINTFISAALAPFNAMIDGLNLVPGVHIPSIKLKIPSIPALAQGGIVSQPTMAMVGDNKRSPEAIAPLHDLMAMIQSAVSSSSGNSEMVRLLSELVKQGRSTQAPAPTYLDTKLVSSALAGPMMEEFKRKNIPFPVPARG